MKCGTYFMQGDEAVAEGAIAAGCRFFAGYPITPASEIAERLAQRMPEVGGVFLQMEDEIASIFACVGASWAGSKAMTATSGPGFSLMQEGIGYAAMTETPLVIVDVQRSGPSTGQATLPAQGDVVQARFGSHGDYEIIALSPNSVQEAFDLTVEAFNLSERYRVPVILLADGEIGHMREKMVIPKIFDIHNRLRAKAGDKNFFGGPGIAAMPRLGDGLFPIITGSAHRASGIRDYSPEVHRKIVQHLCGKFDESVCSFEEKFTEDCEILIIAYGITSRPALGAVLKLREEGVKAGLFRPITLWPSPKKRLAQMSRGVEKIVVAEMSMRGYKDEVERAVKKEVAHFVKIGGIVPTSEEICDFVMEHEG
jgi:2-oxoglutarate ferredoxin oxidoreductase subunit alpha